MSNDRRRLSWGRRFDLPRPADIAQVKQHGRLPRRSGRFRAAIIYVRIHRGHPFPARCLPSTVRSRRVRACPRWALRTSFIGTACNDLDVWANFAAHQTQASSLPAAVGKPCSKWKRLR
jgi:hypothetical protein